MPVCIAGMHRSGTSMVTRLLQTGGLFLGSEAELVTPAPDNPEGFWENTHFVKLNDAILACLQAGWDLPPEFSADWDLAPVFLPLRTRAAALVQRMSAHEPWGWKDPRNSLTLLFWQRLIPQLKIVICLRHPLDVWHSLAKRGYASQVFGLNLWQAYNQHLLAVVPRQERIVTHYDAYFYDPRQELQRVLDLLGLPTSDTLIEQACSSISTSLRHHRTRVEDLLCLGVPSEVTQLYMDLCAEAGPVYQLALRDEASRCKEPPLLPAAGEAVFREAFSGLRLEAERAAQEKLAQVLGQQLESQQQLERRLRDQLTQHEQTIVGLTAEVLRQQTQLAEAEQQQREARRHYEQHEEAWQEQVTTHERRITGLRTDIAYLRTQLQETEQRQQEAQRHHEQRESTWQAQLIVHKQTVADSTAATACLQTQFKEAEQRQKEARRHYEQREGAWQAQLAAHKQTITDLTAEATRLRVQLQELEHLRHEVQIICATLSFKLASRVIWPLSDYVFPPALRTRVKRAIGWCKYGAR